ncbi:MAG: site-specific DNA-methyltransferase [Raineya sp.]|nr:site-specific DNA-methyltransferase [Raineya sp.]
MLAINQIYCLDYREFLSNIDEASIDLAIIDPPYNLKVAEWDIFNSFDDFLDFTYDWIDRLLPKLKETGSLYIFNTPFNSAYILQYLVKKGLFFRNWITWDKRDGFAASKKKYNNAQETILFFTKSNIYTFHADDIRIPYDSQERIKHAMQKGILKNGKRWFPNPNGKLCTDVWHISSERHKQKQNGKTIKMPHATPKPLEMIQRIIKASSNEGDLILDCFSGLGTTAIASYLLKRNFICGDKNLEYVEYAKESLQKTIKLCQTNLEIIS